MSHFIADQWHEIVSHFLFGQLSERVVCWPDDRFDVRVLLRTKAMGLVYQASVLVF